MKYKVEIVEIGYGSVLIHAKNQEEADKIARQEYDKGTVKWDKHIVGSVIPKEIKRDLER